MPKWTIIGLGLFLGANILMGQTIRKGFGQLEWPEKRWAMTHPFAALKAWKVSRNALAVTDSLFRTRTLAGPLNGGPIDAFRHAYWISGLCQAIGPQKALRLARAHERANFLHYQQGELEEEFIPDRACSEMDWWNNSRGIEIWSTNPQANPNERMQQVLTEIQMGHLKVIRQNAAGEFVDYQNKPLPRQSWEGFWLNQRVLVVSGQKPE